MSASQPDPKSCAPMTPIWRVSVALELAAYYGEWDVSKRFSDDELDHIHKDLELYKGADLEQARAKYQSILERDRELQQAQQNLDADLRDWKKLADELDCESTREAMSKRIKELRGELQQAKKIVEGMSKESKGRGEVAMSEPTDSMEKAAEEIMSVWRGNVMPFNEQSMAKIILEHAPSSPAVPCKNCADGYHGSCLNGQRCCCGSPAAPVNAEVKFDAWTLWRKWCAKKSKAKLDMTLLDESQWQAVFEFAEMVIAEVKAHAASETARADRAEQELDGAKRQCANEIKIAQRECEWCAGHPEGDWDHVEAALKAAGLPIDSDEWWPEAAPEVTPSPCCANPNLVVKGRCDREGMSGPRVHKQESSCKNWRPTIRACTNCGKEEKI